jgi:hypothetical protein
VLLTVWFRYRGGPVQPFHLLGAGLVLVTPIHLEEIGLHHAETLRQWRQLQWVLARSGDHAPRV